jgi:hypothetical protein
MASPQKLCPLVVTVQKQLPLAVSAPVPQTVVSWPSVQTSCSIVQMPWPSAWRQRFLRSWP